MNKVERSPAYVLVLGFVFLVFGLAEIILLAGERACSGGPECPVAPGYEFALLSPQVALASSLAGIALIVIGIALRRRITRSRHRAQMAVRSSGYVHPQIRRPASEIQTIKAKTEA
jgi:hypothetical protein